MIYTASIKSPQGLVEVCANNKGVTSIAFINDDAYLLAAGVKEAEQQTNDITTEACRQLAAYFNKKLKDFDLPLDPKGTAFQQRVWAALLQVQYGDTASYLDIAKTIGNPKAVRAVGMANGRNPIAIVVPCHRIIGSNKTLTGYAGGLSRKQYLLNLEGAQGVLW